MRKRNKSKEIDAALEDLAATGSVPAIELWHHRQEVEELRKISSPGRAQRKKSRACKYPDAMVERALRAAGGLISVAARSLGCDPQVIYKRLNKSEHIKQVLLEERERLIDIAECALKQAIVRGEGWAVCFALKTLGKTRGYIERIEHDYRLIDSEIERELARLGLNEEASPTRPVAPDQGFVN